MIQAARCAVVLGMLLFAAALQVPSPDACAPEESSSHWTAPTDAAACVTEAGWKFRALQQLPSGPVTRLVFSANLTRRSGSASPPAPAHLLHVPLLI